MHPDIPGSTLLADALAGLETTVRELSRDAQQLFTVRLERLQHAVASLGLTTTARPPRASDEYLQDWTRYLQNPRQQLTPRTLRSLCWEPEVATTSHFRDYLDQSVGELSTRMFQGLVRSCHAHWSPTFAAGAEVRWLKQRLGTYHGPHRVLAHWREHAETLLGPNGHQLFADSLLAARVPIKKHCEAWAIEESSQYALEVMRHAVQACQEHLGDQEALRTYLLTTLLPWERWPVQDFHAAVGEAILHPITANELRFQDALTTLVLQDPRLGDPRLPRNLKNWVAIREAHQRLLQWLSRADITFFFEHVLGKDPQGRKAFWLRYVSRVLMSRPLLKRDDEVRLRVTMQSLREQTGHFGHIKGRTTSAFLLDFGPVVVVEFSEIGSCYLYEKTDVAKVLPDFWSQEHFDVSRLKDRFCAIENIRHIRRWQGRLAQRLARYGIRPG